MTQIDTLKERISWNKENKSKNPNIALLRKHVEWVEEQEKLPEIDRDWSQSTWRVSRSARALGLLRGFLGPNQFIPTEDIAVVAHHCGTAFCVAGNIVHNLVGEKIWEMSDMDIQEMAMNELRITTVEALALFAGNNTASAIREIAEFIAGERL